MKTHEKGGVEDPMTVLDRRLASGEITKEEYEEVKRLIRGSAPGTPRRRGGLSTSAITIIVVLGVVVAFAFTSLAMTYGPWRTSQDGSWPWGGCCDWGGTGGMGDHMGEGMMDGMGDYDVVIVNYAFSPQEITVSVGATVTWMNMDHVMHTVSFGHHEEGHENATSVESGPMYHMDVYQYTFTEPGVYDYHCDPHPYMTGTVIVEA